MNIPLNIDWHQILLHLFNFTILFAILYFLLYSPVKKFMESRELHFKKMDEQAKENLQKSEDIKSEYESKLNNISDEIAQMKERSQKEANTAAKLTIEQSKAEADKLISDAKNEIEREHKKMLADAKNEISDIVSDAVEKIVLNSNTQASYDSFLNAVKRSDSDE